MRLHAKYAPPGWLSGERVGLMTGGCEFDPRLRRTSFSDVFSPFISAEACEKSSWWFRKKSCARAGCEKARKHMCVTDHHDMTLAVKVALTPNTTNQPNSSFPSCFKGIQTLEIVFVVVFFFNSCYLCLDNRDTKGNHSHFFGFN